MATTASGGQPGSSSITRVSAKASACRAARFGKHSCCLDDCCSLDYCDKREGQAATAIIDLSAKPWIPLLVVTAHQNPRKVQ